jgi:hypothetical protein
MIVAAARAAPQPLPRPRSGASARGLRFQRRAAAALTRQADAIGARYEAEPWFTYVEADGNAKRWAVPDGIFTFDDRAVVIEMKLTFVPEAVRKLAKLYVPLVERTSRLRVRPLVLCRHLTPQAALLCHQVETLSEVFSLPPEATGVMLYLGSGPILWTSLKPMIASSKPNVGAL